MTLQEIMFTGAEQGSSLQSHSKQTGDTGVRKPIQMSCAVTGCARDFCIKAPLDGAALHPDSNSNDPTLVTQNFVSSGGSLQGGLF